MKKIQRNWPN